MLKSSDERVVINDFVQGDPLSEENLDKTLELVSNLRKVDSENPCKIRVSEGKNTDKIRLLFPNKSIWLYSGYRFNDEECWVKPKNDITNIYRFMRQEIIKNVDVMVDGRYIDSQRDITLRWRGSKNQRVIDIKQTLEKGEIVLWCE